VIESVWEYIVKKEARGQFELAYGPGGAWSRLFAGRPGFCGTTVLRDTRDMGRYLTIDLWETEEQREQALAACEKEYAAMADSMASWIESKTELGIYSVLAKGTVRPHLRAGKKSRDVHRGGRRTTRGR